MKARILVVDDHVEMGEMLKEPLTDAGYSVDVADSGEEAIAWLDCEVRHTHYLGSHTLFIGELVDAGINDDDKRPASMSDTRMKYGGGVRGGH